jgi:CheY-like chemotaxis protein
VAFHNFTRLKRSCLRFHETQLASTEGNVGDLDVNANRGPQRIKRTQRYFTSTTTLKRKELLGDVLTVGGFRVITASDSLEAGASWKGLRFDLALLDYRMPILSGSQLAQEIKTSEPNVPIVLISGYTALAAAELLFVDAHFGRDTGLDDLVGTMWSLVRCNRMSASDRRAARVWSNAT